MHTMDIFLIIGILITTTTSIILLVILLIKPSSTNGNAESTLREELRQGREDSNKSASELRSEITSNITSISQLQNDQLKTMSTDIKEMAEKNQSSLDSVRTMLDERVKELRDSNEKKLDEMRKTVDEKLQDTLEKRLGESFKLVSDRLESVQRGLGEMQTLATGVGDLKRVLTNVKTRGTWGEVQLGALLEQILAPAQYQKNVQTNPDSSESVEFALKFPGQKDDANSFVWLPIDSKFPQEDYLRIQKAADNSDQDALKIATDALSKRVKASAQEIHNKYINPPHTTDFAIMFLATEGLYAEIIRQPDLVEELQLKYRIMISGPTTLAAVLNSFRVGFQTLAIEKRASEVRQVLSAVKTEFSKFGDVLDRVKKQLNSATRTIEQTGVRTRAMEKELHSVEQLPSSEATRILRLPKLSDNQESKPEEENFRLTDDTIYQNENED